MDDYDEIVQLRAKIKECEKLLREVQGWHRDPDSPDYNECDKHRCYFCEQVDNVLGERL